MPASAVCDLVSRAEAFSLDAHKGQVRKHTGLPYSAHTHRVAQIVSSVTKNPIAIAAAHLHHVAENPRFTHRDILCQFGMAVGDTVFWLTDPAGPQKVEAQSKRNTRFLSHIARATSMVQTIKLADMIDDIGSIAKLDLEYAQACLPEKQAMLHVLTRADKSLMAQARIAMDRAWVQINKN